MKTIEKDIMDFIKDHFQMEINKVTRIDRGLLNLKWTIETSQGRFFVKQYNQRRYPKHRLTPIKKVLAYQNKLNESGVCCPKLYTCQDTYIMRTNLHNHFMLSDYKTGHLIKPGKINQQESYSVGYALGKLHSFIQNESLDLPQSWTIPTKETLLMKWNENNTRVHNREENNLYDVMEKQRKIFETIDLSIFEHLPVQLAHNDFWCDNLLFKENDLTAILDFDRFNYSYQSLDVGRAILSLMLDHHQLCLEELHEFMKGYNEWKILCKEDVTIALQLCYIRESLSWIGNEIVINNGPPERFKEEMIWLTTHFHELDKIIELSHV